MTIVDYAIDILLIAIVFRQMRTRELTLASMALPLLLVAVACLKYLQVFTPTPDDLALIALLTVVGAGLGAASAVVTRVWPDRDGRVLARAGLLAAVAWVAGMGFRLAFAVWSTHGGAVQVVDFSIAHHISGLHAWITALLFMAVAEVLARVGLLQVRRVRLRRQQLGLSVAAV